MLLNARLTVPLLIVLNGLASCSQFRLGETPVEASDGTDPPRITVVSGDGSTTTPASLDVEEEAEHTVHGIEFPGTDLASILETAIVRMNLPEADYADVSATLINLTTGEQVDFQGGTERYPASTAKLLAAIHWLAETELDEGKAEVVKRTLAGTDFTDANTATAEILDAIAGGRDVPCDRRYELLGQIRTRFPASSIVRRLHPYKNGDDELVFSTAMDSCDENAPRNFTTTNELAAVMQTLVAGDRFGLSDDESALLQETLVRNQFDPAQDDLTKGFFAEHLPEDVTVISKVGFTESDGFIEVAAIVYHPDGQFQGNYVLAAASPSGYDQALAELSGVVYQGMANFQF